MVIAGRNRAALANHTTLWYTFAARQSALCRDLQKLRGDGRRQSVRGLSRTRCAPRPAGAVCNLTPALRGPWSVGAVREPPAVLAAGNDCHVPRLCVSPAQKSGPAQGGATSERCSREHLPGAPLSTTVQCASSFLETLHKGCHPHPLRLCPHYIARFPSVKGNAPHQPQMNPRAARCPRPSLATLTSWSNMTGAS